MSVFANIIDALVVAWHYLRDLQGLIAVVGSVGLWAIIFAETGLLVGFFLPGDSLLLAAGLYVARAPEGSFLGIWTLGVILSLAAILGDATGYAIGRKAGRRLFERKESFFFRRSHLAQAEAFYEQHGGKAIILARFMPIVRTFAPTLAGVANMGYLRFAVYNVCGGLAWIWSFLLAGYFLARRVPGVERHLHVIVLGVIVLSVMPIAWKAWRGWRRGLADAGRRAA